MNKRIFVEKKPNYQTESISLQKELNEVLNETITNVRLINVYDCFNVNNELIDKALYTVFAEKVTDVVSFDIDLNDLTYIAYEYLPGQYDLRADSVVQCLMLIDEAVDCVVKSSKIIILENVTNLEKVKKYIINPIETRIKDLKTLILPKEDSYKKTQIIDINTITIESLKNTFNLAMSLKDIENIINYFKKESRNPTEVEIRLLDAYWSDHCRHTTFETELDITIEDPVVKKSFEKYLKIRKELNRNTPITLMDMATINARLELKKGNLEDLEISEENNACSIYTDVLIDGVIKKYLLMFKNETHNHPTEVEPFGGASTCIGGAIRDPMSGRSYVYQAVRITGAGDITASVEDTLPGKLPQRFISKTAASGNSSYGNQIGLANTLVKEIFHPGYVAKRMELGAVVGCSPVENVVRKTPQENDLVLLLGGKTGRDGIGGATGSSKEHDDNSLEHSAAEVQKGNAPEERKLVRLYRNKQASRLIKKSNDFGAGGVSVAIGELAPGLEIYLDKVPLKYSGLNEAEIALSESQERMAVVIDPKDFDEFTKLVEAENCSYSVIAKVTNSSKLVMLYNNQEVVNIDRNFLDSNSKDKKSALINKINFTNNYQDIPLTKENVYKVLGSLNVSSLKGLQEMFDSTIGASTVLCPLGGIYKLTENQVSVSLIPVVDGVTTTASILAHGFDPYLMEESPYYGAMYSVVEALTKVVSVGGDYKKVRFSFQEFFEKLGEDKVKWGKPIQSLLGTVDILEQFNLASIGGKDSMSGTFKDINVPPTLVAFAVCCSDSRNIISGEFKKVKNKIYLIKHNPKSNYFPNTSELKDNFEFVHKNILNKSIVSSYSLSNGGLIEALFKCSFGNKLGFKINTTLDLFNKLYGSILVESTCELNYQNALYLGEVSEGISINNLSFDLEECLKYYTQTFESIYPTVSKPQESDLSIIKTSNMKTVSKLNKKEVNVLIPVFPGTNCDMDIYKSFKQKGGNPELFIFKNNQKGEVITSIKEFKEKIKNCDILALAGGFSAGDEPDGSGKFIANVLNNPLIKEEIINLTKRRGLVLGICNGFQALVKAGFLPNITNVTENSPTLFKNDINRHVATTVKTTVISTKSPWTSSFEVGDVHTIPVSHGEGKFIISKEDAINLFENGQVAFCYCDNDGTPTMDPNFNVNGSFYAIEGITSPDGLILGKMGHSERSGEEIHKNIYGNKNQDIFKNAINYFLGV